VRWTDPGGRQPAPDPNAPPTFVGPGITIRGGKVDVGPTLPVPLSECDELNPACKALTLRLPGLDPQPAQPPPEPQPPPPSSSTDPADRLPPTGIKLWGAPIPDYVWRKVDPNVTLDPYEYGLHPKDPNAKYTLGEHAAGDYPESGTQYLSASHKPGGATNFKGDPYAINPDSLPPDVPMHDTPAIADDYARRVREGAVEEKRYQDWLETQGKEEGVPRKPGQPPKGEVRGGHAEAPRGDRVAPRARREPIRGVLRTRRARSHPGIHSPRPHRGRRKGTTRARASRSIR